MGNLRHGTSTETSQHNLISNVAACREKRCLRVYSRTRQRHPAFQADAVCSGEQSLALVGCREVETSGNSLLLRCFDEK